MATSIRAAEYLVQPHLARPGSSALVFRTADLTGLLLQVSVFVNGKPIPFNMKIGEAGEAFFVFETDEDVPEELMTSPLLEPVRPGQDSKSDGADRSAGRFGAKKARAKEETALLGDVLASSDEGPKAGATSVSIMLGLTAGRS